MFKLFYPLIILSVIFLLSYLIQNSFHSAFIMPAKSSPGTLNSPNLPEPNPISAATLDSIFAPDHSWTKKLDPAKTVTIIATGDIIPARVTNLLAVQKNDFSWAFKNIADTLKSADLTFINLESPLIQNCKPTNEGMTFCGDIRHIQGLQLIGADVVSLANNHSTNYGPEGVGFTKNWLEANGIITTGINGPAFKYVKNINIGFLGYNDIEPKPDYISIAQDQKICDEIKLYRRESDILVVTYHWGIEYRSQPDERQKQLGHLTIDCGADLVIGNHPHWIQPVEFYKGKLITYAHGNTVFDQEWSQKTKEGVVGRYTFFDRKLVDVEYLPLLIENYGQPHFLESSAKQKILDEMKNQSEILSKELRN